MNTIVAAQTPIKFILEGPIVPKARPRVTRNGSFIPPRYRQWKEQVQHELGTQLYQMYWNSEPLSGVSISIQLTGKHSRRGDLDNIAGAILDCMVAVGILKDDNCNHVHQLAIALNWGKSSPIAEIEISPFFAPKIK